MPKVRKKGNKTYEVSAVIIGTEADWEVTDDDIEASEHADFMEKEFAKKEADPNYEIRF